MKQLIACLALLSLSAFALDTGAPAPDFTLPGLEKETKLSELKGKIVVLEWLNHGCPFVKKHYGTENMQALQKKYTEKGVVWLSVISSAAGKQGHVDRNGARTEKASSRSAASDILLDPVGKVGQLYGAKTTPHMFVIGRDGLVAYQGAIDDRSNLDWAAVKGAKNFVAQALDELLDAKRVSMPTTKAYGCAVKY